MIPSASPDGSSPIATGGGGVTFEHKVAALFMAASLTGRRIPALGESTASRIAFQTGPSHEVDDLLVTGSNGSEVAVACRLTPNFVPSHKPTVGLVKALWSELDKGPSRRVMVAVAGQKAQWNQVAQLADLARKVSTAADLDAALRVPKRWPRAMADRFERLSSMVAAATSVEADRVTETTFNLLERLWVVGFSMQAPDGQDWADVATQLDSVAAVRGNGPALRDRLAAFAGQLAAAGGVADERLMRRNLGDLLKSDGRGSSAAWSVLDRQGEVARAAVRDEMGGTGGDDAFALPFLERREALRKQIEISMSQQSVLIVTGESGSGKSALTLSVAASMKTSEPFELVALSLRELPGTMIEFESALGDSFEATLHGATGSKLLVIDAADAATEGREGLLRELLSAAGRCGFGAVAVTAEASLDLVEKATKSHGGAIDKFTVDLLSDVELQQIGDRFPLIAQLLSGLPAISLLRRLIVVDLLARTGLQLDAPMSEWACLELIWKRVMRGDGRRTGASAHGREEALLAIAAAELKKPAPVASTALDGLAIDSLRADYLLAGPSLTHSIPRFAHDEIRRYAVAVLLAKAPDMVLTLRESTAPRWALSAASLAIKGKLVDDASNAAAVFEVCVRGFADLGNEYGPRWSDVPIESVLDTPVAYEALSQASASKILDLNQLFRVAQQRAYVSGFMDAELGAPIARLISDAAEPWAISKLAFEVLTSWLQSLALQEAPAGNTTRIQIRDRLLSTWRQHPAQAVADREDPVFATIGPRRGRRRRELDYEVTDEKYVETLALLGLDSDDDVGSALRDIAALAPAWLGPAADSPFSAMSLAQWSPQLLAELVEAYYVDNDASDISRMDFGIRDHQGRWRGIGGPFSASWFGGFSALFRSAPLATSAGLLNRMLNHSSQVRARREPLWFGDESEPSEDPKVELDISGERREYVGDGSSWAWYRGTTVGAYPCMSALQAMERLAEQLLDAGVSSEQLSKVLMEGCQNLAVPGLLFGLLARRLEDSEEFLDAFIREPVVWTLEFSRSTHEYVGFKASSEGLRNPDRRTWSAREVCVWLMVRADEDRRAVLKSLGQRLVERGLELGYEEAVVRNWAANFDIERYQLVTDGENQYLQVNPPPENDAANAKHAAEQEAANTAMRLQNRYWAGRKSQTSAPSAAEVAGDLEIARALLERGPGSLIDPRDGIAHLARTAVVLAGGGQLDAYGVHAEFAIGVILTVARAFATRDSRDEGQYFDLGADRAAALALPHLLLPTQSGVLGSSGVSSSEIAKLGRGMARQASLETRLYLARGCDPLWTTPCAPVSRGRCVHDVAIAWLLDTARSAEMGPWNQGTQSRKRKQFRGDVLKGLQRAAPLDLMVGDLDPLLRGLGSAASTIHCKTREARAALAQVLDVQARALVKHARKGYSSDSRGTHTRIAARAMLQLGSERGADQLLAKYADQLRGKASLLSNLFHGISGAGAEDESLASSARNLWPGLAWHALDYSNQDPNVYRSRSWGDWAVAALIPDPLSWAEGGLYDEVESTPIDWVSPTVLGDDWFARWIPIAQGNMKSVDAAIRFVKKCEPAFQATTGLGWIDRLCRVDERLVVDQSYGSNEWLLEIRPVAESCGTLPQWQQLVDAMVVGGNSGLAGYST